MILKKEKKHQSEHIKLVPDPNKPADISAPSVKTEFFKPRSEKALCSTCLFSLRKQENLICFAAAGKGGRELARDCVVAATKACPDTPDCM